MTQAAFSPAQTPRKAMLLAAGLGTRMRPLTAKTAKPLLPLGGRALLDHALDRLADAGVETVVVNTHWQADSVEAHLAGRETGPTVIVQREDSLRDTGGAVAAALAAGHLGTEPFYVINGDAFWLDGPIPVLLRLASAMQIEKTEGVLLLHRTTQVASDTGAGDFALDVWGHPRRPTEHEQVPYTYAGIQILSPRLFQDLPPAAFSMNLIWDRAIEAGQLRAIVHDGVWFHLSTPPDLARAEVELREHAAGNRR
ncbi:nucleotidyltransferase family protein [Acidisoma cellulosilytica]|uniref:Nucleotidyltransferase family protein n=1 Tax=Acidisoma cellulosilyticum TaxID=2802395 RepID=A0A963Z0U1_9PROT|nr:nucleotidyltransferase family protein [Acidisoma cellulosilyticum]MCB8880566.1 nucleotidyltransferase family protein [Acidisoma cellulosilyticum]